MPKKKRSLGVTVTVGLGKGLWWSVKGGGKALWWAAKGTAAGIGALARKAKDVKQKNAAAKPASKEPPKAAPAILIKQVKGDYDIFSKRFERDSLIVLIAGRRGSGKSATAFRLLENIHASNKRPCYAIGPKQNNLPAWITSIGSVEDAKNGGVILVDEGAITFSSRNAMSDANKDLAGLLAVARHKDLTLILITQNTGMIDNNVLRLCDTLVFKEGSLLQERFERSAIKDLYETANKQLNEIPSSERMKHCYIFDAGFEGILSTQLPSFWTSGISKNQA